MPVDVRRILEALILPVERAKHKTKYYPDPEAMRSKGVKKYFSRDFILTLKPLRHKFRSAFALAEKGRFKNN